MKNVINKMSKLADILVIIAVVFLTLLKGEECLIYNYDTDTKENCTDQNLTLNKEWKEFYL